MSPSRPYVDFEQAKQVVSLPEVIERFGLSSQFTQRGNRWVGICPFPQHKHGIQPNDQQFSFDNNKGVWMFACWGDCKAHGSIVDFICLMLGCDLAQARLWLAREFSDRLTLTKPRTQTADERPAAAANSSSAPPTGTPDNAPPSAQPAPAPSEKPTRVADGRTPMRWRLQLSLQAAKPFLDARGISLTCAERYGVGLSAGNSRWFKGYICVPCFRCPRQSPNEPPLGYVGRWPSEPDDEHPRYKLGFETRWSLFNLEQALTVGDPHTHLVVVEGVLTALWLIDRGYHNTVAAYRSSLTDEQAALLIKTGRPIALAFDGDEAGQSGMRAAAGKLITDADVRIVKLAADVSPDDLSDEELTEHFAFCRPAP